MINLMAKKYPAFSILGVDNNEKQTFTLYTWNDLEFIYLIYRAKSSGDEGGLGVSEHRGVDIRIGYFFFAKLGLFLKS